MNSKQPSLPGKKIQEIALLIIEDGLTLKCPFLCLYKECLICQD